MIIDEFQNEREESLTGEENLRILDSLYETDTEIVKITSTLMKK